MLGRGRSGVSFPSLRPAAAVGSRLNPREVEPVLWRHALDAWYPRSLDRVEGGFLCDFDYAWQPSGPQHKLLEFQSRQTRAAAVAARRYPQAAHLREAAEIGFSTLAGMFWDREYGGWFHLLDRAGTPLEAATKHAHGFAYAFPACVAVYQLTGDAEALEHARQGFLWLDRHAHDSEHGGYIGFMDRGGRIIHEPQDFWPQPADSIGVPYGCKDLNVLTDMLDGLTVLAAAWPDGPVPQRLAEIVDIVCDRLVGPDGELPFLWSRDWRKQPGPERIGYLLQGARRLAAASSDPRALATARRLLARGIRVGWDARKGGFFSHGGGDPADPAAREKLWWVQWEGFRSLAVFDEDDPSGTTARCLAILWSYIRRFVLDRRYGGSRLYGLDSGGHELPWISWRTPPTAHGPKATMWKDASHETLALLAAIARLEQRDARSEPPGRDCVLGDSVADRPPAATIPAAR